jgi:ATP-binding cassette subfamily B protein
MRAPRVWRHDSGTTARPGGPAVSARLAHLSLLCMRAGPWMYMGLLTTTIITGFLPVGTAWSTKIIIDSIAAGRPAASLLWWSVLLAMIALTAAVAPHLTAYLDAELVRRVDRRVQERLYTKVTAFSGLSRFESPEFLDKLRMAALTTGSALTPATTGLFSVGRSLITLLSLMGALYVLSPVMTLVLVAAAIPALAAQILLSRQQVDTLMLLSPANRRYMFYKSLITDVRAAKEARLLGLGAFLRDRLLAALAGIQAGERRLDRRVAGAQAGLALLGGVVAGAGLVWAVRAAAAGHLTAGDVSAFVAAVAGGQGALAALVVAIAGAHQALLMFGHHQEVIGLADDLPVAAAPPRSPHSAPAARPGDSAPPARPYQGIELRDVWFRYDGGHPWVLRGVTMTIPNGRSVALVGLNGAGKSTLIKLLCRFYDPIRGAIYWDGVDIREMPVKELRRRMGVLFQDFMTYDLTAAENIGVGDLSALHDRPRIHQVARAAGIHEHIDALPRGYDTMLSRTFAMEGENEDPEAGVVLSGGQWQRLAFARTLLRGDSDLLILDEPSAGLDAEAEHRLHQELTRHRAGRTSLLVSHRLNVIRAADVIVVLSGGRIGEQGTHAQLIRAGGRYARLFRLQASGYDAADNGEEVAGDSSMATR